METQGFLDFDVGDAVDASSSRVRHVLVGQQVRTNGGVFLGGSTDVLESVCFLV